MSLKRSSNSIHLRKRHILFGLPEGDFYAAEFVRVAQLSGASCRFVGYSWCAGRLVRAAGYAYRFAAIRAKAVPRWPALPAVAEYRTRRFLPQDIPRLAGAALAALAQVVDAEMEREAPDLVVFGPAEHAVCHLLYEHARSRRIPTYGFQPCYVGGGFVLNPDGPAWEDTLRMAAMPLWEAPPSGARQELRTVARMPMPGWPLFVRGAESVCRLAFGNHTFDTWRSLGSNALARVLRRRWFPWAPRVHAGNLPAEFVLITLHQPCLGWKERDWQDLIDHCLVAVPSHYVIILRPHPTEEPQRVGAECRARLLARGVLVSDPGVVPALGELIDRCKAVFTLTSATGFQALLRNKMVFALAPAFYCRAGLARHVSRDAVNAFTDWLAEGAPGPDRATVAAFDAWLRGTRIWPYPTNGLAAAELVTRRLTDSPHD